MSTKRITSIAVLTAIALTIFIAEAQIPVLIAVPGIKLGLSNIITLVAAYLLSRRDAGIILMLRIFLGSVFSSSMLTFFYSAAGGLCAFAVICIMYKLFDEKQIWAVSVIAAMAHNIAQLLVAIAIMNSPDIIWFTPWLVIAAVVTGTFTGIAAQLSLARLKKIYIK